MLVWGRQGYAEWLQCFWGMTWPRPEEAGQGVARSGVFPDDGGTPGTRVEARLYNSLLGLVSCTAPQSAFPSTGPVVFMC